jgi:predicted nucleic acid-binding protein
VIEAVLDASVVLKWFNTAGEQHLAQAQQLRASFERGELLVVVPPLLFLELLNTGARRWKWDGPRLERWAQLLTRFGFEVREPPLPAVARWAGRGLTAYDACYLALAEERKTVVITADDRMLALGGSHVRSLEHAGTLEG